MFEILAEVAAEIAAHPMRLVLEVVQFLILLAIMWVLAVGWGRRRGILVARLETRRDDIHARLERANGADDALREAQEHARTVEADASRHAEQLRAEARSEAERIEREAQERADGEAERLVTGVRDAIDAEHEQMEATLRTRLVETVAHAARSILSERVPAVEQRRLIERAVIGATEPVEPDRSTTPAARSG